MNVAGVRNTALILWLGYRPGGDATQGAHTIPRWHITRDIAQIRHPTPSNCIFERQSLGRSAHDGLIASNRRSTCWTWRDIFVLTKITAKRIVEAFYHTIEHQRSTKTS